MPFLELVSDSFLKSSLSGLETFVMNAFKTKSFARFSSLSHVTQETFSRFPFGN